MIVKIKHVKAGAKTPTKAHQDDAGFDFYAHSVQYGPQGIRTYKTGVALEIPKGYVGLLFARSSSTERNLTLANAVGVIDSGYRGEITFKFRGAEGQFTKDYALGERIGQLVLVPQPEVSLVETETLDFTPRGDGAFGSTGT